MAANTSPIFLRQGKIGFTPSNTTGVTGTDGTDANVKLLFTADATNGSKVEEVIVRYTGAATATVLRFWVNNGSAVGTATNNTLIKELTIPTLASLSQVADNTGVTWAANLVLPAGYKLYCAAGTSVANALHVNAVGGDY